MGSEAWRSVHGDTYGATDKPLGGGMPGWGESLTDAEIRLVAAFERAEYGGEDRREVLSNCGVVEPG
jgi:mono/diheme cytochrome c family protein